MLVKKILNNQKGYVLPITILIAAIILVVGVMSTMNSNTEVMIVRNEGQVLQEFYGAEGGVLDALEHYNSGTTNWLTDSFLLAGPGAAGIVVTSYNQLGSIAATVEARCIEDTGATINSLSTAGNSLPQIKHIGPPPIGHGYSIKFFEARKYGVTATSNTGNTHIQIGAWKVFNKY